MKYNIINFLVKFVSHLNYPAFEIQFRKYTQYKTNNT